jgi:hypothetical protein
VFGNGTGGAESLEVVETLAGDQRQTGAISAEDLRLERTINRLEEYESEQEMAG